MGGYLYKGDVQLKGNFEVISNKPLDSRSVVQNKTELFSMDHFYSYKGMPVVSVDDASIYILIDPDHIGDESGWKRVGTVNIDTESGDVDLSSFVTIDQLNETVKNEVERTMSESVVSKDYLDQVLKGTIKPPVDEWVESIINS